MNPEAAHARGAYPNTAEPVAPYALPASGQQPGFPAMPASPAEWRYHAPGLSWWQRHRRTLQALAVITLLALCGLLILALVREQTGTQGLLVGLGLALFPVPLLIAAFRWLDGVRPTPWRSHAFAFAWGACAATLVALLANSFASDWLTTSLAADSPDQADTLSAAAVAPVVEEIAKSAAILLLFLHRRQQFTGVVSGLVIAGITAAGFAFTENVLYLGTAYDEDAVSDGSGPSTTAATFFIRIVVSPFAHPLFTALVGVAFGIVAALPGLRRAHRIGIPLLGLLTAVLLHAIWNGAASFTNLTFLAVYGFFMLPVFAALTWLSIWARRDGLRTVREVLPEYAQAGWFAPPEPHALGSMRARTMARNTARRFHGPQAARTVAEYQHFATSLAQLRASAELAPPAPDFAAREQELLHHLWQRRALAGPPTVSAALSLTPRPQPAAYHWGAAPHGAPAGAGPYPVGHGFPAYAPAAQAPPTAGATAYGATAHGRWGWPQGATPPPAHAPPHHPATDHTAVRPAPPDHAPSAGGQQPGLQQRPPEPPPEKPAAPPSESPATDPSGGPSEKPSETPSEAPSGELAEARPDEPTDKPAREPREQRERREQSATEPDDASTPAPTPQPAPTEPADAEPADRGDERREAHAQRRPAEAEDTARADRAVPTASDEGPG